MKTPIRSFLGLPDEIVPIIIAVVMTAWGISGLNSLILQTLILIFVGMVGYWWPEVTLALFLFVGQFKAGIQLPSWLDLTLFVFGVSILGAIYRFLETKRPIRRLNRVDTVLLVFAGLVVLGSFKVPLDSFSLLKAARFIVMTLSAYFLVRYTVHDRKSVLLFLSTIMFLGLAAGVGGALNTAFDPILHYGRIRLHFTGANRISVAVMLGFSLLLYPLLIPSFSRRSTVNLVTASLPLVSVAFILANSRGPWLSFTLSLAVLIFFYLWEKRSLLFVGYLGVSIVLAATIAPSYPVIHRGIRTVVAFTSHVWDQLWVNEAPQQQTGQPEQTRSITFRLRTTSSSSLRVRLRLYGIALSGLAAYPFLGVGTGRYHLLLPNDIADSRGLWYPHNIFLEIAAENGLIGLLLFLSSLVMLGVQLVRDIMVRKLPKDPLYMAALILFLMALSEAQLSGSLIDQRVLFGLMGLLSLFAFKEIGLHEVAC